MAEDVLYRFPWGALDKPRSDRALREALQVQFGAKIDADDPTPSPDEPPPDDIDYEVAIPARFAQDRHKKGDAPLPAPDQGHFMGVYTLRADEEGALLCLPWRENAHVWSIMTEIVETVAKSLGGWREGSDVDEPTDPSIPPRAPSNAPPPQQAPPAQPAAPPVVRGTSAFPHPPPRPGSIPPRPPSMPPPTSGPEPETIPRSPDQRAHAIDIQVPSDVPLPSVEPLSVEPTPNTKPSVGPGNDDLDPVRLPDDGMEEDDEGDRVFPSWESLKAWVADAYSLEEDDGGESFAVTMTWSATPRKQIVRIGRTLVQEEAWITFRSGVCRRGRLSADQALKRSASLPFARIVSDRDRYDLVYSFPLPGLTIDRFTVLLENVAEMADDLENEITRGGDEF